MTATNRDLVHCPALWSRGK